MYSFGKYNARSGFTLFEAYQAAEWMGKPVSYNKYTEKWRDHFDIVTTKVNGEMPEPCVVKSLKRSALRGGLKPIGEPLAPPHQEYVMLKSGEYFLADMGDIRPVTDKEYDKLFRNMYTNNPPKIRSKMNATRRAWDADNKVSYIAHVPEEERYCEVRIK